MENLSNNQELFLLLISSFILLTFMFDSGLTWLGEIRCQSLLEVKGLKQFFFFCIRLGIILHQTGIGHNHSHGGGGHSHDTSHSHNGKFETVSTNRISRSGSLASEKQNINVRAAFIHVLGDIVQSVGVLIAAYVIKYKVTMKRNTPSLNIYC